MLGWLSRAMAFASRRHGERGLRLAACQAQAFEFDAEGKPLFQGSLLKKVGKLSIGVIGLVGQSGAGKSMTGKVICVGAKNQRVAEILGWDTAASFDEAINMGRAFLGNTSPDITLLHHPPIVIPDVS